MRSHVRFVRDADAWPVNSARLELPIGHRFRVTSCLASRKLRFHFLSVKFRADVCFAKI